MNIVNIGISFIGITSACVMYQTAVLPMFNATMPLVKIFVITEQPNIWGIVFVHSFII